MSNASGIALAALSTSFALAFSSFPKKGDPKHRALFAGLSLALACASTYAFVAVHGGFEGALMATTAFMLWGSLFALLTPLHPRANALLICLALLGLALGSVS